MTITCLEKSNVPVPLHDDLYTGESLIINAAPIPDELREKLPPVCDDGDPLLPARCECLSGALSSHDKFQFIYDDTEGRFKVSGTPGALSSFYLYHRYAGSGVNLVAGSGWAATPDTTDPTQFPIQLEMDYICVYQRDAFKQTATFGR